jgi:MFS family permease
MGTAQDLVRSSSLRRRLLPLHIAVFLHGFILWVPVEKLFMNEIGFNPATIGVMAAAYAAVVPIIEIPSGVLADRWSRRGVLVGAGVALAASSLIGGLSYNVGTYILAALALGVYFAMYSGTLDAMVYDTILEEIGDGAPFERQIGRVRLIESVALVTSSLAGGVVAGLTSPRLTYLLSVPFSVLAGIAYFRFAEPQLHKAGDRIPFRNQLAVTYRTLGRSDQVRPIVAVSVLTAVLMQVILEFGPLWLVAIAASAVLYGPYWAAVTSSFGIGALLAGRLQLHRRVVLYSALSVMIVASVIINMSTHAAVVTLAHVVLILVLVLMSIRAAQQLNDSVSSTVRAGVSSGVGALSWMAFLPFALVFGALSEQYGVYSSGWMITGATVLTAVLLARTTSKPALGQAAPVPAQEKGEPVLAKVHSLRGDMTSALLRCSEMVELATEFLEGTLDDHIRRRVEDHLAVCTGCRRYLEQIRRTTEELAQHHGLPADTREAMRAAGSTTALQCKEFVELVTAYLESGLNDETKRDVDEHLSSCGGCQQYLDQIQHAMDALRQLPAEGLPTAVRDELVSAFRHDSTRA